jgi:NAD(P)-dependent dehydrogenase (short-subunit alcohol dehydrogenase family)
MCKEKKGVPDSRKRDMQPHSAAKSEFEGKVAIVTGAGRGIGEAVALAFARRDARMVLVARTRRELEKVAVEIRQLGSSAMVVPADVSKPEDVDEIFASTMDQYGRADVLVNAAAILGPIGRLWEVDPELWADALRVNLLGTFLCCRAVIPHLIAGGGGKIINFSGGGATSPSPRLSAYGASKAAIVRLTETLAAELEEFHIQVNAIAPGMVHTRIHEDVLAAGERAGNHLQKILRMREQGADAPVELPAELAVFLASRKANGLSGKLIAAPHDDWQRWDDERIAELAKMPWLTLRRMDAFTLEPFLKVQALASVSD